MYYFTQIIRYWGTPIPLWISEDGLETVCVGSIAELEELSGVKAERNGEKDLHRETIDKITIPSKRPGTLYQLIYTYQYCNNGIMDIRPEPKFHYDKYNLLLL